VATVDDGAIRAMNLDGSGVVTLVTGESKPRGLAVSGGMLYFTNETDAGSVKKVPIGGGTVTTIAAGEDGPAGIVVTEDAVYWTTRSEVRRALP
jgi:hypothetical protein